MTKVDNYLANIAKKSGEDIEKLKTEFNAIVEGMAPGPNRDTNAAKELNRKYVADKSTAVMKTFIVVGMSGIIDYTKKRIANAMESYHSNPDAALQSGIVKQDGNEIVVIDTKEFFDNAQTKKNKNFGKQLTPQVARQVLALMKNEGDEYEMVTINLRGKKATGDLPPLNVELNARLNGDAAKGYSTSEKATEYKTVKPMSGTDVMDLLSATSADHIKALGECMEYHKSIPDKTPEFYNRYVMTAGDVNYVGDTKEGSDSYFMVLDDITADQTVRCFVPAMLAAPQVGQTISVVAKTSIGKGWDSEKGEATEEDVLQLNVMGIVSS